MRDFTLLVYRNCIQVLLHRGYTFETLSSTVLSVAAGPLAVLRHDVDRRPARALAMAELEHQLGVSSTYFFRTKPCSFHPGIMKRILDMGHEIGYHYEDLSDAGGDTDRAWVSFKQNLKQFDQFGGVQSIAMHGRPLSKWDNRDIWDAHDYKDAGVMLEAYADVNWKDFRYFTDVGRCWNSKANLRDQPPGYETRSEELAIHSTYALKQFLETTQENIILSTHPERWTDNILGWWQVIGTDSAISLIKTGLKYARTGLSDGS